MNNDITLFFDKMPVRKFNWNVIGLACWHNLEARYLDEFFIKFNVDNNEISIYRSWIDIDEGKEITGESKLELVVSAGRSWGENERAETLMQLRKICADFGRNDWPDELHLGDAIEKNLARYLWRNSSLLTHDELLLIEFLINHSYSLCGQVIEFADQEKCLAVHESVAQKLKLTLSSPEKNHDCGDEQGDQEDERAK